MESPARLADEPTWNLVGERVALGPLHAAMLPLFVRWLNDFEVTCTLALGMRPMTREAEQAYYKNGVIGRGSSKLLEARRPIPSNSTVSELCENCRKPWVTIGRYRFR